MSPNRAWPASDVAKTGESLQLFFCQLTKFCSGFMRSEKSWSCWLGGGGFHSRWCMETRFLHNINCKVSQKWENCVIRRKKTQLRLLWNEAGWFGKYSVTKENKPGDKRSFRIWRMGAKFMLIYSLQSKHSCRSCTFPYFLFLFKPFSAWGNTWLTYQLAAWDGEKVSYQTVSVAEKWFP